MVGLIIQQILTGIPGSDSGRLNPNKKSHSPILPERVPGMGVVLNEFH